METAQKARLDSQLDRLWRDSTTGEVYTLRQRIESGYYSRSHLHVRTHANKKTNLECKKLKSPIKDYSLVTKETGNYIGVTKLVFDYFNANFS